MSNRTEATALAWAADHPGAVLTSIPFLLASFKVVAVSSFSLPVQLAILSSSSIAAIVLGTAISLTPTVAAILFVSGLVRLAVGRPDGVRLWSAVTVGSALYLALIPFLSRALPALVAAAVITLLVAGVVEPFSPQHPLRGLPEKARTGRVLALSMAIAMILASFNGQPWIPVERLQVDDEVRVGYVISEDSAVQFLDHRTRVVEIIARDRITDRELCRLRLARRSIAEIVRGRDAHGAVLGPCAA